MRSAALFFSPEPRQAAKHAHAQVADVKRSVRSFIHEVTPSQRIETYAEAGTVAIERVSRNVQTSREEVRKILQHAFTVHVGQYRNPAKEVAEHAGTSPATIASFRQKLPEAVITTAMICANYPGFAAAFAKVANMEAELHPDAARYLNDLILGLVRER